MIIPNRKCVEQASAAHLSVQRGGTSVYADEKKIRKKEKENKFEHCAQRSLTHCYSICLHYMLLINGKALALLIAEGTIYQCVLTGIH